MSNVITSNKLIQSFFNTADFVGALLLQDLLDAYHIGSTVVVHAQQLASYKIKKHYCIVFVPLPFLTRDAY